jgi:peptidoglycan/xylan/chitin deacetylase (PgdA/CDA1 family)
MSLEQARAEIQLSRELIERHTGFRPEALFYPLGAHGAALRRLVEQLGLRAAFVAWGAPIGAGTRRFGLPRYSVEKGTDAFTFGRYFEHGS